MQFFICFHLYLSNFFPLVSCLMFSVEYKKNTRRKIFKYHVDSGVQTQLEGKSFVQTNAKLN